MKKLILVAMVLIQRKGGNDGGEGGTVMGWPLRKKRRGRGVCGGWRAGALGFREFRYLTLCKSEPVGSPCPSPCPPVKIYQRLQKAAGGTSAGRLNQGMTQLLTHDSLTLSLTLHN